MTIQLDVVVWTIINFVLLFAVLHFLLFKPMLKVMDARNDKIKQGRSLAAKRKAAQAENEEKAAAYRAQREKLLAEKVNRGMEPIRADSQNRQTLAEQARKTAALADSAALAEEEVQLKESLAAKLPLLSDAVVQRLLEKGL